LRDGETDCPFNIAGCEIAAALELFVEGFEHAARLFAG